jgi:hypothetical protein
MSSASFARLAVVTASTRRSPAVAGGKRGPPATHVSSLACTPLDPVDPEVRQRLMLESPNAILETFMQADVDIVYGDVLVVAGIEYPVKLVEDWYWPPDGTTYRHVYIEKIKP